MSEIISDSNVERIGVAGCEWSNYDLVSCDNFQRTKVHQSHAIVYPVGDCVSGRAKKIKLLLIVDHN